MFRRYKSSAVAGLALSCLLIGCGGSSGTDVATYPTMLFVNASADTTGLDLWLNESVLAADFQYLESNADFTAFEFISDNNGAYDIITQDTVTFEVYDAQNQVFVRDTHSVIVAVGLQNFGTEFLKRLQSITVDIDRTAPNGNKARLYVVHAFVREAGFATPPIKFQNPGQNPQFTTASIDYANSQSITVDSGPMDWDAVRADSDGTVVYASKNQILAAGGIYLVLVSGIENDATTAKQPAITFIELTSD